MIKVNLLGDDTGVDHTGILFVGGYIASVVVLVLVFVLMFYSITSSIGGKEVEVASLEKELLELQEITKEVKELEKKRKALNSKLEVIARLKRNKTGPVRVIDDLNLALPERAWLTSVRERGANLRIYGYALDDQTIAMFMKDLEQSDYYLSVGLVETKQTTRKGVNMREFTLEAKISYSGKLSLEAEDGKKKGKGPNEPRFSQRISNGKVG